MPHRRVRRVLATLAAVLASSPAVAATAPAWMHALVNQPDGLHEDKTVAIALYSESVFAVQAAGKIKRLDRVAYRILRPDGVGRGIAHVTYDAQTKITELHGWCIPASGMDYEVKDRDAYETAYAVDGGELISDLRTKLLRIPASVPGSIVGYEVQQDERPFVMGDEWDFQDTVPVRETRYTLQLPTGWTYKATWLNHAEVAPTESGPGQWTWTLTDLKAIKLEENMPPWRRIAGRLVISLIAPDGKYAGFQSWGDVGTWYQNLARDRRVATPEIKQKVAELTATVPTLLGKIQALAAFVQTDIRYVAIELGIGGFQPHAAADVFSHRHGDCKDKATLLSTMLGEIGVESYYVIINTERGAVTSTMPPNLGFDHAILAVRLPPDVTDPSLLAVITHPKLGRILFFDPTNHLTPFGHLMGALQANFGVLVTPDGGELLELPQLPTRTNSVERTAKLKLTAEGRLVGEVYEVLKGDPADERRYAVQTLTKDTDKIKPLEATLAESLGKYEITEAKVGNLGITTQPLTYRYSFEAENFGKRTGDLILVRPRVLGVVSKGMLEKKEPRTHTVEFSGPERDSDVFDIELPPGVSVDELPEPINTDVGYASYHSKTEIIGHSIRYSRVFEIRELSVPVAKADELRKFYRAIFADEGESAVLKQAGK